MTAGWAAASAAMYHKPIQRVLSNSFSSIAGAAAWSFLFTCFYLDATEGTYKNGSAFFYPTRMEDRQQAGPDLPA